MEAIVSCIPNLEFITQEEIKEILKLNSKVICKGRVNFEIKKYENLAELIYYSRSIIKGYLLLEKLEFKSKNEIMGKIKNLKSELLKESFVVRCERTGNHDFNSMEIEKEAGEIIFKNTKIKVDLKNPETTITIDIIDNNCFIGIDFAGIKLSKRDYRVKLTANSLNPCLAYCMLRISNLQIDDIILDPYCRSGEIAIESALYLLKIPNCIRNEDNLLYKKLIKTNFKNTEIKKELKINAFDSNQYNLTCLEINSKIASVKSSINISRLEVEWLDTKFEKNSVDKIITFPPYPTNSLPLKLIEKLYKELFYQSDFVLKNKGAIIILTPIPEIIEKYSKEYKFKKTNEIKINYLNKEFSILVLEK